jgi:hypothetical protein
MDVASTAIEIASALTQIDVASAELAGRHHYCSGRCHMQYCDKCCLL